MATCLAALSLAGCFLAAGGAGAAAEDSAAKATLDRSVRFLQEAQNPDGGFGGVRGQQSDPLFTAWAAYALAAAGINPQDQAQLGAADVFSYLTAHTSRLRETTDFDRIALVAIAAGASPRSFGSVDPLGAVLARQLPDGSFPQAPGAKSGWINSTIWSIFPLSTVGDAASEAAVGRAADWLVDQQRPDGGWGATSAGSEADTDMTGAAIQALAAAGRHGSEAERRALDFLRGMQGADGGFRETPNGPTNSATTAWAIQGLWAAGVDPRSWRTETGADPLGFLAALQRADGSIGWTASSDLNSLWMTAQAGPALAGHPYPLSAVPRAMRAPRREAPEPALVSGRPELASASREPGHGGAGLVRGDGVIAGGGGRGAPLYSAPQPQSGGSTPGGERQIYATGSEVEAVPSAATPAAAGEGWGGDPAASGGRAAPAGGPLVEGMLVGGERSRGPAAPGLFSAERGGDVDSGLLIALLGGLGAAAAIGSRREGAGIGFG